MNPPRQFQSTLGRKDLKIRGYASQWTAKNQMSFCLGKVFACKAGIVSPFSEKRREWLYSPCGAYLMTNQPTDSQAIALQALLAGLAVSGLAEPLARLERRLEAIEKAVRAKPAGEGTESGWLDASKAAVYLDMSAGTFDKYRYGSEPRITGYKVGGKTLYKREDLDRWVKLYELRAGGRA